MNQECKGPNCKAVNGVNHSVECLFEHFLGYTQACTETKTTRDKLKKAYFDGYEAGAGDWIPVENQLPREYQVVIVYVDRFGYYPNYLSVSSQQKGIWMSEQGTWKRVSHWRPMPLAPEKREDKIEL